MNFSFHSPVSGLCTGRLWATGRYGFSLPKKVEITTPDGAVHTYLYANKKLRLKNELANRTIVRIAISHFLRYGAAPDSVQDIDPEAAPYDGELTPTRPLVPRTPLRVRPGKLHARTPAMPEPA